MIRKYKTALMTALTALLLTGTGSCIKDDLSGCPDDRVRVQIMLDIETTRGTTAENYQIDAVQLYVFDAQGAFVTTTTGGAYTPDEDYFLYPEIEPGDYRFVVWTNVGDHYKTSGASASLSELQLYLDHAADACVRTDIPDLHHGILNDAEVVKNRINHFTIVLSPNTNRINVRVEGLPATADDYGFTITDDNGRYNFDNSFGLCAVLQYIRTSNFATGQLGTSIKVLRLTDDRTPAFAFVNDTTGEMLFADNLIDMIRRAYAVAGITVDFDTTHTFDIVLKFDTQMRVTVSVNGWNYTVTPGQLG